MRPLGAPNFAYGDPDFSTNWVVSLADSTAADVSLRPRIRYTTVSDDTGAVIDPGGLVDLPAFDDSGAPVDLGSGSVSPSLGSGGGRRAHGVAGHHDAHCPNSRLDARGGCGWRCRSGSLPCTCSTARSPPCLPPCAAGPGPSHSWS